MVKENQKAKLATEEESILSGFNELISTFNRIADKTEQTMPLLSSSMRHSIQIVKLYKEAFNATKGKRA
jgi:hypothetical protein